MTRRDIVNVAAWALGTFGLALVACLPPTSHAVDGPQAKAEKIDVPKLNVKGCSLSLKLAQREDGSAYKPGDTPAFELTATNPTDANVDIAYKITLMGIRPESRASRMPTMPRSFWQQDRSISLKAGETATVRIVPDTTLPASQSVSVVLSSGQESVTVLRLPGLGTLQELKPAPQGIEEQTRNQASSQVQFVRIER